MTKRTEFEGAVWLTAKALADMPHGGQIIMDEKSFDGIKLQLADLYETVPHSPNYEAMETNCRCQEDAGHLSAALCPNEHVHRDFEPLPALPDCPKLSPG